VLFGLGLMFLEGGVEILGLGRPIAKFRIRPLCFESGNLSAGGKFT
jgi:hypothetical protein